MKESKRKCFKCGSCPAVDDNVTLYRFPKPGKTNSLRCEAWARYCFPNRTWSCMEFQYKLHTEHRMLCHKHFKPSAFIYEGSKKLAKCAVPHEECQVISTTMSGSTNTWTLSSKPMELAHIPLIPASAAMGQSEMKSGNANTAQVHNSDSVGLEKSPLEVDSTGQDVTYPSAPERTSTPDIQDEQDLVPEPETFSWQKTSTAVPIGPDEETGPEEEPDNVSLYCDAGDTHAHTADEYSSGIKERLHRGFRCDACHGDIVGYRYTCVQCADYDLCSACECGGATHSDHYMLRVPHAKHHSEVQPVVAQVREMVMMILNTVFVAGCDDAISIKSEVKDEELEQDQLELEHDIQSEQDELELEHNEQDRVEQELEQEEYLEQELERDQQEQDELEVDALYCENMEPPCPGPGSNMDAEADSDPHKSHVSRSNASCSQVVGNVQTSYILTSDGLKTVPKRKVIINQADFKNFSKIFGLPTSNTKGTASCGIQLTNKAHEYTVEKKKIIINSDNIIQKAPSDSSSVPSNITAANSCANTDADKMTMDGSHTTEPSNTAKRKIVIKLSDFVTLSKQNKLVKKVCVRRSDGGSTQNPQSDCKHP